MLIRKIALVLLAACAAEASDWARWRGPDGSGISKETEWKPEALKSPKVKWKANVGEGNSCMSVAGKFLYTMGFKDKKDFVYCFDAETGKEIWKYSYPGEAKNQGGQGPGTNCTPVVDGAFVYTLSNNGLALCLDAKAGRLVWQQNLMAGAKNIQWGISGSPLVAGPAVIFNVGESGVAVGKQNGQKGWSSSGPCGYSTPVAFKHNGADCVAIFSAKSVIVLDVKTGAKRYSFPWVTSYDVNAADPVYFDGKLFITSGYDRGCALIDISGTAAKQVWENKNMRSHFATPIYLDGCLYGVDGQTGGGQLRCLDAKTGEVKWSQGGGFETFNAATGKIIALDSRGNLIVCELSPAGYKELAKAPVLTGGGKKWTSPVLANGLIYCRDGEGELVCIDAR